MGIAKRGAVVLCLAVVFYIALSAVPIATFALVRHGYAAAGLALACAFAVYGAVLAVWRIVRRRHGADT